MAHKRILFFIFLSFYSLSSFSYTNKISDKIIEQVVKKGRERVLLETGVCRETVYSRGFQGPIVKFSEFKYGLTYSVSVWTEENMQTGAVKIKRSELSIMEIPYCDFKYKQSSNYRFRRRTFKFTSENKLSSAMVFSRVTDPRDNTGVCGDQFPSQVFEAPLDLDMDSLSALKNALDGIY